jgi:hypothetical protein
VKQELQNDLHIHDSSQLPTFINLPQITAAEYGRVRCRQDTLSPFVTLFI